MDRGELNHFNKKKQMKETEKICIIDDDEIYIFLIKKSLSAMGINNEVISFINGSDALEALIQLKTNNEELPGIILLDINMPIMDGWMGVLNRI